MREISDLLADVYSCKFLSYTVSWTVYSALMRVFVTHNIMLAEYKDKSSENEPETKKQND